MINLNHSTPKVITKPWGSEHWHILTGDFCVKTIRLIKGSKTSFQYHRQKEEINLIRAGTAEVWLEDEHGVLAKHIMTMGDSFFVPPTRKHRVVALTDVEMFEVSNRFVDDVVRISDEFGRGDGRIEAEHQTPAVLILAAGLGSRLKHLTETKNKGLLPIANKAVISHIIERFPREYDIVVAVGYMADTLVEYCRLAHPDRRFTFVSVLDWSSPKTDPGHSAFQCREHLQRPFYLTAVDGLIDTDVPHIDGNWIGVYPTAYPEKYATVGLHEDDVVGIRNKGETGFDHAFIGLAAILDYATFWRELERTPTHELVSAWNRHDQYPTLKAKTLRWFDTGNLDDLSVVCEHLGDNPLSSHKTTPEVIYHVNGRVLKMNPDPMITTNRAARAAVLHGLVPDGIISSDHILAYDWQKGSNLYVHDSLALYNRFLDALGTTIDQSTQWADGKLVHRFYTEKTQERLAAFVAMYGDGYLSNGYNVNGYAYPPLASIMSRIDFSSLIANPLYSAFHGDLHFDNLIYDEERGRFIYIDWRESFGGEVAGGDLYYDLGKLYAGCLVPFELLKDDRNVSLSEGSSSVMYSYPVTTNLLQFTRDYQQWIIKRGYDLKRVQLVAGLALLNIAPLHTPVWNKALFFTSISLLHEATH